MRKKKKNPAVWATQSVVLCHGSPRRLIQSTCNGRREHGHCWLHQLLPPHLRKGPLGHLYFQTWSSQTEAAAHVYCPVLLCVQTPSSCTVLLHFVLFCLMFRKMQILMRRSLSTLRPGLGLCFWLQKCWVCCSSNAFQSQWTDNCYF